MSSLDLGNVCNIITGKLNANQAVAGGEYPFFTCAALPDEIDHYSFDDDVVLVAGNNARGNFHVTRFQGKFNAYQRTYVLTAKSNFDINYIYYSLKLELNRLREKSQGSQTKFLTMPILTGIQLRDISKDSQQKVTVILSALDAKIELNNRINAELEAMAKTLYDYWFVQFDFPDENGNPYKSSGGKMVYNEELKREIPEGWDSCYIGNILKKVPATKKVPSKEILTVGLYPVIDQSMDFICGFTNEAKSLIKSIRPHIVFGDHTRTIKLINFDFARGADGTQVLLSSDDRMPQHLFYLSLLKIDLSNYGYARHFKFLKETSMILPKRNISEMFEIIAQSAFDKIKHNTFQNQQLAQLRDWLLPMLMNGQVTVK